MSDNEPKGVVVVIDDDSNIAELVSDFCAGLGHTVHVVTDSRQAFDKVRELKPNLITLDLQMPNVDGFDVLKKLKEHPDTRDIPVIVLSILAGDAERQGLLAAAQAILTKPINFRKLQDKMNSYFKDKRS